MYTVTEARVAVFAYMYVHFITYVPCKYLNVCLFFFYQCFVINHNQKTPVFYSILIYFLNDKPCTL